MMWTSENDEILIPRDLERETRNSDLGADVALALLCLLVGGVIGWFAHIVWG